MRIATELSRRELLAGPRLAVLPVGSFEVHNEDLPLGTDSVIAEAVALLVCTSTSAVRLPTLHYTYAGVTATLEGTISVSVLAVANYLAATLTSMLTAGLGPLVLISAHGGNDIPCTAAIEHVFHAHRAGLLYCNVLGTNYHDVMTQVWGSVDVNLAENASLWAAWEILGLSARQRPDPLESPEGVSDVPRSLRHVGHVPHTYGSPRQHIRVRKQGTVAEGRQFLQGVAGRIASVTHDLMEYHDRVTSR